MSATYMHLSEMQWQLEPNDVGYICGVVNHENERWRPNDAVKWVDFKEDIERTRIKMLWVNASKHSRGAHMEKGVDLSVAQGHYKGLVK